MNWFPQLAAGAIAQFPLSRSRLWRNSENNLEGGGRIMLPDPASGQIEWRLAYRDLADPETQNLNDLFTASQGRFGAFAFIDPLANLLGWSEDLARPDWQAGLLQTTGGINGPGGAPGAWSVANTNAGSQSLQQTLSVPAGYTCCFSVYARSDLPGMVTLSRDASQNSAATGPIWTKLFIAGEGAGQTLQSTFALAVPAGQTIEIWGLQVEAQPYPSAYKPTAVARGIYQETYFTTDELLMTSEGVGRSSCQIVLTSRV